MKIRKRQPTVPGRPLYQFVTLPFALCNAPQTMCRLMDKLIPPHHYHVFVYLDNVLTISNTFNEYLQTLPEVALCIRKANLTINVEEKTRQVFGTCNRLWHHPNRSWQNLGYPWLSCLWLVPGFCVEFRLFFHSPAWHVKEKEVIRMVRGNKTLYWKVGRKIMFCTVIT